jgi:hypothetical protein
VRARKDKMKNRRCKTKASNRVATERKVTPSLGMSQFIKMIMNAEKESLKGRSFHPIAINKND